MTPDIDALARTAAGDARDVDIVVRMHEAKVRGFLARVVSADLVDELAQRTFVQAWRNAASFRGDSTIGTWLLGIAWRSFLMEKRSTRREQRRREAMGEFADASYHAEQDVTVDVARLLAALPVDERAALVLGHGLGHSQSECAAILGLPLGTFKSLQAVAAIAEQPMPATEIPQRAGQIRQAPVQAPQPHRDYVRPPEGLAPRCHSLRPMPNRLLLRRRARCHRHLPAMTNES